MVKPNFSKTLGKRIVAARKAAGLTQGALAEAIGSQQGEVSKWENGSRRIYAEDLVLIAIALEVPPSWLIEGDDALREILDAWRQGGLAGGRTLVRVGLALLDNIADGNKLR